MGSLGSATSAQQASYLIRCIDTYDNRQGWNSAALDMQAQLSTHLVLFQGWRQMSWQPSPSPTPCDQSRSSSNATGVEAAYTVDMEMRSSLEKLADSATEQHCSGSVRHCYNCQLVPKSNMTSLLLNQLGITLTMWEGHAQGTSVKTVRVISSHVVCPHSCRCDAVGLIGSCCIAATASLKSKT